MSDEFSAADVPSIQPDDPSDRSTARRAAESIKAASKGVSDAIDAGREPGMPLDTLARLVREAPLPSLLVAFLLGVIVARRR